MKIKSLNKYLTYSLLLIAGLSLGWLLFHDPGRKDQNHEHVGQTVEEPEEHTIWTCSMHPQIRMDKPGDCPICGMDLIPVSQSGSVSVDPDAVHFSREAAQLANVMTSVVSRQKPVKQVRLYGRVQVDERLLQSQVAHVPGRIERLNVNFTGETVRQGQALAEIYSPELITAQQELLQTYAARELRPQLYEASRERLKQWKITGEQIDEIERSGKITSTVKVYSNTSGTVVTRNVNAGDYVSQGTVLYGIADLSRVWILFDAYESDLPFIEKGREVKFTLQALPGKEYSGNISFIDPVIDPVTRVARLRVEVPNRSGELKPEMFVTGIISSHPDEFSDNLAIPRTAVLWTGKRSIVYVKQPGDEMIFKMREVELGPVLGDSYIVTGGLGEGEEIVTNGTFSVDASAQLEGKPSMMNPPSHKSDKKIVTDKEFTFRMNELYENYLELKNALVAGNAAKAGTAAGNLQSALTNTGTKLPEGDAHDRWADLSERIGKSAEAIASTGSIEAQRIAFSSLSDNLYAAIKTFGLDGKTVYWQFCPMSFDDKGAYWLSEQAEIRNPYFGDMMLTCGETKETIK